MSLTPPTPKETLIKFQKLFSQNKKCADCKKGESNWVNMEHGTFICSNCATIHLLYHCKISQEVCCDFSKVRPLKAFDWERTEVNKVLDNGNENDMKLWEAKIPSNEDREDMRLFIKQKYVDKRWASESLIKTTPQTQSDSEGESKDHLLLSQASSFACLPRPKQLREIILSILASAVGVILQASLASKTAGFESFVVSFLSLMFGIAVVLIMYLAYISDFTLTYVTRHNRKQIKRLSAVIIVFFGAALVSCVIISAIPAVLKLLKFLKGG